MQLARRIEVLCGVAAGILGWVIVGLNLLVQDRVSSVCTASGCVTTRTNALQSQPLVNIVDALLFLGGPPLLVGVGAVWSIRGRDSALVGSILLWLGTAPIGLYAFVAQLFVGGPLRLLAAATFALAVVASIMAIIDLAARGRASVGLPG